MHPAAAGTKRPVAIESDQRLVDGLHSGKRHKSSTAVPQGGKHRNVKVEHPVEPAFLIGRRVIVQWDKGWYRGTITQYVQDTLEHKIEYEDGDTEQLIVGLDVPVKVLLADGEQLPLPAAEHLTKVSELLLQRADKLDAAAATATGPAMRRQRGKDAYAKRKLAQDILELADTVMKSQHGSCLQHGCPAAAATAAKHAIADAASLASTSCNGAETAANQQEAPAIQQLLLHGALHAANIPGLGFTHIEWQWQQLGSVTVVEEARQHFGKLPQLQSCDLEGDMLRLEQVLNEAADTHERDKQEHKLFKELDVSLRMCPEALVGRCLRVFWPLDDAWFLGAVEAWDPETGRHKVAYEDGTCEELWIGIQRVRLLISAGEQLPPPDALMLRQLAHKYVEQAQLLEQQLQQQRQQQQSGVEQDTVDDCDQQEDCLRPQKLRSKAQILLGMAHIKNSAPVAWTWMAPQKSKLGPKQHNAVVMAEPGCIWYAPKGSLKSTTDSGLCRRTNDKKSCSGGAAASGSKADVYGGQSNSPPGCNGMCSSPISGTNCTHSKVCSPKPLRFGCYASAEQAERHCAVVGLDAAPSTVPSTAAGDSSSGTAEQCANLATAGVGTAVSGMVDSKAQSTAVVACHDLLAVSQMQSSAKQQAKHETRHMRSHRQQQKQQHLQQDQCQRNLQQQHQQLQALLSAGVPPSHNPVESTAMQEDNTVLQENDSNAMPGKDTSDYVHGKGPVVKHHRQQQQRAKAVTAASHLPIQQPEQPGQLLQVKQQEQEPKQPSSPSGTAVVPDCFPGCQQQQPAGALRQCGKQAANNVSAEGPEPMFVDAQENCPVQNNGQQPDGDCTQAAAANANAGQQGYQSLEAAGPSSCLANHNCNSNSSRKGTVTFSITPGDIVWVVQGKGIPAWPALVITPEEANDFSVPQGHKSSPLVCVQYFGEYTRGRVNPASLLPTCVVLQQRLWLPSVGKKQVSPKVLDIHRLGLKEVTIYWKTGELPNPEMVPEHNDERWLNIDESPDETVTGDAAGDSITVGKGSNSGSSNSAQDLTHWAATLVAQPAAATDSKLPLQLGQNLVLLSLGNINYIHPAYHNETSIWPVGYAVRRRARSPASGAKEIWHLAEILEAADGKGPLFRVTPEGGKPVSGSNPTAAWQGLYKSPAPAVGGEAPATSAASAIHTNGLCGARLFGLKHAFVKAAIQALPNAAACDRFLAWQGGRPPPIQLSEELLVAKRAIATRLQSLPQGITPLPLQRRIVAACDACGEQLETDDNQLVECDCCRVMVHMRCYGIGKHPDGSGWLCDVCRLPGLTQPPPCVMCPRLGGAMKVTAEGGWCHLLCATWIPGMCVLDQARMEPIIGASKIGKERRSLKCSICNQQYGACIQCAGSSKCYASFHPTCARDSGWPMAAVWDEDSASETDGTESTATGAHYTAAAAAEVAAAGTPLDAAACMGSKGLSAGQDSKYQQQQVLPSRPKRKSKTRKPRKEGTAAGDNTRLFCFCPKHQKAAVTMGSSLIFNMNVCQALAPPAAARGSLCASFCSSQLYSSDAGAAARSASAAVSGGTCLAAEAGVAGQEVTSPQRKLACIHQQQQQSLQPSGLTSRIQAAGFGQLGGAKGSCARSRRADTAFRRGMRAPDALAAALRKRLYVRALPYLITGCTHSGHLLPPPIKMGRTQGPEFQADWQQQQQQANSKPQLQQQNHHHHHQQQQQVANAGRPAKGAAAALWHLLNGSSAREGQVLSLADRYQLMTATVPNRLAMGKSAIHGLGVFAKVPHKAGDLVIEYSGHLVRPCVADMLEARTYNQMVGAGTYIFRLNAGTCVDATRAGNMAHLINHCCAPCCYSRIISVRCPDKNQLQDHVVIVASRDIAVGEELTYDYRFAGDEKLHCNCGAATCRGWVNAPTAGSDSPARPAGSIKIPRHELEPVML